MSEDLKTLEGTEREVWATLHNGVEDPTSPARTVAFATASSDGGGAVRMVVLRGAQQDTRTLTFYTHRASAKVAQLKQSSLAEVLVWDDSRQFQIRVRGDVAIENGPRDIWDKFHPGSQQNYASDPAPGTAIPSSQKSAAQPDASNFLLLTLKVAEIETLWLSRDHHRRAIFTMNGANWLVP